MRSANSFGVIDRKPTDSMKPLGIPRHEMNPRCTASVKIVSRDSVPEGKRRILLPDDLEIEHYVQVQVYMHTKGSTDEQVLAKEGLTSYLPIRRVQPHWTLWRTVEANVRKASGATDPPLFSNVENPCSQREGHPDVRSHLVSRPTREHLKRRFEELRAIVQE